MNALPHISLSMCNPRSLSPHWANKATMHQVTTILVTSKNVPFPGLNHLLTTGADNPSLELSPSLASGR